MIIDHVESLNFEEVRDCYTEYLKTQDLSPLTIQTARTDSFYLLRYDDTIDFWELLRSDDFEAQAFTHLHTVLKKRSNGNVGANINSYMSHLRRLKRFLYSSGEIVTPTYIKRTKPVPTRKSSYPHANVPQPTANEVTAYQKRWDTLDDYREQERALDRLFFELAPKNEDIADILLKATTLNSFYSTNIFSIYPVAIHIQSLHIDARLKAGDESLVNDMMAVTINGKQKQFYSFASKYCSHHNPQCYPIYDSYVDVVLRYFRDTDRFLEFRTEELKAYYRFKEILVAFRSFYGLEQFSLKEIDKYLWQLGKKHFPKEYKQNLSTRAVESGD